MSIVLAAALLQAPEAEALERFLAESRVDQRQALVHEVLAQDLEFEALFARLRQGRTYAEAPTGLMHRERTGVGGLRHPYTIIVPEDYDPAKRYPVRFNLHGGMGAPEWKGLDGAWANGWTKSGDQIVVLPAGWWDSMWWEWSQAENFEAILREVRATWNVDEERVALAGTSDGGAALFFQAMRSPDRWSGYAGFVAPPDRLVRADFRPDGQMHMSNLAGQSFHLGYGSRDRKVPLKYIEQYMALFAEHGAQLDWYANKGQGHDLTLTEDQSNSFVRFIYRTTRETHPKALSWATERTDRYNRRSWLVIDELEPAGPKHKVDESNILPRLGTRLQLKGPTAPRVAWGGVDLVREGNHVTATSRRVAKFRLLISPDAFDLSQPIQVELNGKLVFDQLVEPSAECLLRWAATDDDRTRLYAAELPF